MRTQPDILAKEHTVRRPAAVLGFTLSVVIVPAMAHAPLLVGGGRFQGRRTRHGHVYFEESPRAGDGFYLDPFIERGTTWIRTMEAAKPAKLPVAETKPEPKKRWLSCELPAGGPRSVDSYGKWGVYRYGQTDVLLHYYARYIDVSDHDDLHELSRAAQMALDIVPHDTDGGMELTVLWQGKPAAGRDVDVRGPQGLAQAAQDRRPRSRQLRDSRCRPLHGADQRAARYGG